MRLKLIAAACLSTLLTTPAMAEEQQTRNCGTVDEVRTMLTEKYHETPVGYGVAAEGQVMMTVYATADGATWTIVVTRARDGMACIASSGTDWQASAPAIGEGL